MTNTKKHITIKDIPLDTNFNSLDELLDSKEFNDFMELLKHMEN